MLGKYVVIGCLFILGVIVIVEVEVGCVNDFWLVVVLKVMVLRVNNEMSENGFFLVV